MRLQAYKFRIEPNGEQQRACVASPVHAGTSGTRL
nr:helix-turn-helix domain-containing protein [Undibacterium oligocarboniphilum]